MFKLRKECRNLTTPALKMMLMVLLTLQVSGCGFHLRGESKLQTSFSTLALKGLEGHAFRQIVVGKLEKSGVKLDDAAPYTILLLDEDSERRVSAYSTRAKSAGFELKRAVTFKIIGPGEKEADVPVTEMFSRRHLLFRQAEVVGKLDEESMLWQEMYQELAERIVRKLESIQTDPTQMPPAPTGSDQTEPGHTEPFAPEPIQTEPAS